MKKPPPRRAWPQDALARSNAQAAAEHMATAEIHRRARAFPAMLAALEIILPRLPQPLDDRDHSASAVAYRAVAAAIEAAKKPSTSPKEEPCPNPSYPS